MTLKTEREARLLAASKRFDAGACLVKQLLQLLYVSACAELLVAGLSRFDLSLWDDLLAHNVVLHKDSVTLFDDLHGECMPLYSNLVSAVLRVQPHPEIALNTLCFADTQERRR